MSVCLAFFPSLPISLSRDLGIFAGGRYNEWGMFLVSCKRWLKQKKYSDNHVVQIHALVSTCFIISFWQLSTKAISLDVYIAAQSPAIGLVLRCRSRLLCHTHTHTMMWL